MVFKMNNINKRQPKLVLESHCIKDSSFKPQCNAESNLTCRLILILKIRNSKCYLNYFSIENTSAELFSLDRTVSGTFTSTRPFFSL